MPSYHVNNEKLLAFMLSERVTSGQLTLQLLVITLTTPKEVLGVSQKLQSVWFMAEDLRDYSLTRTGDQELKQVGKGEVSSRKGD